jgi:Magnesium chelatase, subunit ChlI
VGTGGRGIGEAGDVDAVGLQGPEEGGLHFAGVVAGTLAAAVEAGLVGLEVGQPVTRHRGMGSSVSLLSWIVGRSGTGSRRDALEALRQPLEDTIVTLARATATYADLAPFTLVAAMDPCPCLGEYRRRGVGDIRAIERKEESTSSAPKSPIA